MTDRIGGYLDGDLPRGALTPAEQRTADTVERAIDTARAFVAAQPAPDAVPAVMRHIERNGLRPEPPRPVRLFDRLFEIFWEPRQVTVRFRPAPVAFAAAVVVALALIGPMNPAGRLTPGAGREPRIYVQFRLDAAGASNVRLAGSFSNWQPQHELYQAAPGVWTLTLPLAVGVHDYAFLVDNERWVADAYAHRVNDGFGGTNNRIALMPPGVPVS